MTGEEQELAIREQGKWFVPASSGWEAFGLRFDQAAKEDVPSA